MRKVLFIPLDEVKKHFIENSINDVKIIVPQAWSNESTDLKSNCWKHTPPDSENFVFESAEFINELMRNIEGSFSISFANEKAPQKAHFHEKYFEIYFSEHRIATHYLTSDDSKPQYKILKNGGLIVFGPAVTHLLELSGMALIIAFPAVDNDKRILDDFLP